MLSRLHIENIAIMDNVDIEFDKGFLVLTGETGAGKSIIIDSVNLLTGERSSKELVRSGCSKAFVEGCVYTTNPEIYEILDENGIEYFEGEDIILSREISSDGRSVVRINNKTATTGLLKALCSKIINIHGQNDNQAILNTEFHGEYVDSFGKTTKELDEYKEVYAKYKKVLKALNETNEDENLINQKKEMLSYQIDEIEKAELKENEEDDLKEIRNKFLNMEKVTENAQKARQALCGSENGEGAKALTDIALSALESLSDFSLEARGLLDELRDINERLWDISESASDIANSLEQEDIDINFVESRLDLINKLKRKYGNSVREILAFMDKCKEELLGLENSCRNKEELEKEATELEKEVLKAGKGLSDKRKENAQIIEKEVLNQLKDLEMNSVSFKIDFKETKPCENGLEKIEFLISANKGQELKPLNKIASGGELSRIILALKVILAKGDKVSTMIFDEVDTGVSGSAAQKIAEKLKMLSADKQVFSITHLAQIAAFADTHYLVKKEIKDGKTVSSVEKLKEDGRENELARIISGSKITDSAVLTAKELIATGKEYGKSIRNC